MNVDHRAALFVDRAVPVWRHRRIGPLEEPRGIDGRQVHAAVAADLAEIVVPVRAVEREAFVKVLHEGHVTQVEGVAAVFVAVHRGADFLLVDHEGAAHGGVLGLWVAHAAPTGAHQRGIHRAFAHVGD